MCVRGFREESDIYRERERLIIFFTELMENARESDRHRYSYHHCTALQHHSHIITTIPPPPPNDDDKNNKLLHN